MLCLIDKRPPLLVLHNLFSVKLPAFISYGLLNRSLSLQRGRKKMLKAINLLSSHSVHYPLEPCAPRPRFPIYSNGGLSSSVHYKGHVAVTQMAQCADCDLCTKSECITGRSIESAPIHTQAFSHISQHLQYRGTYAEKIESCGKALGENRTAFLSDMNCVRM